MDQRQKDRENILKEILRLEQLVISTCDFELDIKPVTPYVERFMWLMYPNHYRAMSPLVNIAASVANDSCYTYANLVFSIQSVALAVCIFSAKIFGLPIIFKDSYQDEDDNPLFEEETNEESKLARNPEFDLSHLANSWYEKNGK